LRQSVAEVLAALGGLLAAMIREELCGRPAAALRPMN